MFFKTRPSISCLYRLTHPDPLVLPSCLNINLHQSPRTHPCKSHTQQRGPPQAPRASDAPRGTPRRPGSNGRRHLDVTRRAKQQNLPFRKRDPIKLWGYVRLPWRTRTNIPHSARKRQHRKQPRQLDRKRKGSKPLSFTQTLKSSCLEKQCLDLGNI